MEKDSAWMHRKLYRAIGEELPMECQAFKSFQQAIPMTPKDKAQNCVEELLRVWENRGGISVGNYMNLRKLLVDIHELRILDIADRHIEGIKNQLSSESGTTDSLLERIPDPYKDYLASNDPIKIQGDLKSIQCKLQTCYIGTLSRLHPIPWCEWLELDLDHIFVNLEMAPGRKDQLRPRVNCDYGDIQLLNRLFQRDHNDRSVCLAEGPAGIGKSTLCRRLVYLWSKNNYRIDEHSFDLTFLLEAKRLTKNVKRCMKEQLFPKDFDMSEDNIYKCFSNHQKKSLLIIDGIEELTTEGKTLVMELLNGDTLSQVNILLTGRPAASREFVKYVNSHLTIKGFSSENVKEYIGKYFVSKDNTCKETLLNRLESDYHLESIMTNPLTAVLVCILVEDNRGDIPAKFSDILDEVLQAYCQKYIVKQNGNGSTLLSTENLISAAGRLAYNGLKREITHYPEETLASICPHGFSGHLLKAGILSKDFAVSSLHPIGFCYFPHKSFQEYVCAKYLAALDLREMIEKLSELVRKRRDQFIDKNIIRFLFGMIQCQAKIKVVLESLCHEIDKMSSLVKQESALDDLIGLLSEFDTSKGLLKLLAQIISRPSYDWIKSTLSLYHYFKHESQWNMPDYISTDDEKRKSIRFFHTCIRKMMLPPVLVVADGKSVLFYQKYIWRRMPRHAVNVAKCTTEVRTYRTRAPYDKRFVQHTAMGLHLPRRHELYRNGPSSLFERELVDISWPFVQCCSPEAANDILKKGIRPSVLSILMIPGSVSVEDSKALKKSLESAKYQVALLFLELEDFEDCHFFTMLSLFSSIPSISFLKMRRAVQSVDKCDGYMQRRYVLDCSIIQMYYSKCCPY